MHYFACATFDLVCATGPAQRRPGRAWRSTGWARRAPALGHRQAAKERAAPASSGRDLFTGAPLNEMLRRRPCVVCRKPGPVW